MQSIPAEHNPEDPQCPLFARCNLKGQAASTCGIYDSHINDQVMVHTLRQAQEADAAAVAMEERQARQAAMATNP